MYFQYGLYKPLVISKIGTVVRPRHVMPALFVAAVAFSALLGVFVHPFLFVSLAFLLTYALAALTAAGAAVRRSGEGATLVPVLAAAFGTLHLAYGLGFACGVARFAARRWRGSSAASRKWIPISR